MNDTEANIQGYQPETERPRDASEYEVQQAMVFLNIVLPRIYAAADSGNQSAENRVVEIARTAGWQS
jgi:hypothetical protein